MAFMAILIIDGAQAGAPTLNNALSIPNEDRVDGSQPMVFAIEYNDPDGDAETGTEIRWHVNGALMMSYDGMTSISSSETVSVGSVSPPDKI